MDNIVTARALRKSFGDVTAIDGIDLDIPAGSVVGLIGPNGAGKTTLLRSLLGLSVCEGELNVLGLNPFSQRNKLLEDVCFIADTAVLPRWMKVGQLLDHVEGVHPRFDRNQAEAFLASTEVTSNRRIGALSKGMMVQVHLAIVMAVDARLLILDEPTLGLDVLFRKRFFEQLLNDYYDGERTILISTHQVEEVENILTDVVFVQHGRKVLQESMEDISERYIEVHALGEKQAETAALNPVGERSILGGKAYIFEGVEAEDLMEYGELKTPSIADLFVAKMTGGAS